jgi:hypothetical protein
MTEINVPAKDFEDVAKAITGLAADGLPVGEMYVAVRDGEMELMDGDASYGVRTWESS